MASVSLTPEQELIAVLQANLAEALALNREFEADLRDAVRAMADCEEQRIREVKTLTRRIEAMSVLNGNRNHDPQSLTEAPHQSHPNDQHAQALQSRASLLIQRAEDARFRHTDSLTRAEEMSEVTLRMRVPKRREGADVNRSRSKSPAMSRMLQQPREARSQNHIVEVVQATKSARGASPSPTQTRASEIGILDSDKRSSAQRARLAKLVFDSIYKPLLRAVDEAKETKVAVQTLETKVRRKQLSSSNAGSSFAPTVARADFLFRYLETIRSEGLEIIASECNADELLSVGVPVALMNNHEPRATLTPSKSAKFDPAGPLSPKWVLVDHRTVVASNSNSTDTLPEAPDSASRSLRGFNEWSEMNGE